MHDPLPPAPEVTRATAVLKALRQHRKRLARKLEAMRADLAEAEHAPEFRRHAEALLAYLRQVPARAERVTLPDPLDPHGALVITLDPRIAPSANAARYFKRAAKAERGLVEIPPRIATVEADLHALDQIIERANAALELPSPREPRHPRRRGPRGEAGSEEPSTPVIPDSTPSAALESGIVVDLERAFAALPAALQREAGLPPRRGAKPPAERTAELPARLRPRRLRTQEGWDVLIGRSNEGNDYLTLHLARPEDYWFHVHGAAGSHVVLRRGKGKDEPSKQTLLEVASWAAFYSQARTAGTVPVIVTRKKYVRKPRKAPAGTVACEREKTLMVRPREPELPPQEGGLGP
jgi:predicted ribosome quality control (RQC) complex YloA/Tae2 family protein